ncbi:MAG: DUF6497 family protein [Rhodobacteraceae bacterium]|nr:DUF6497 family protein [Paracoccaceae bacterium]
MLRATTIWLAMSGPVAALEVPSGQPVEFHEMIWNQPGSGLTYRFRFIAPELGQTGRGFDDVAADFEYLCNVYALPRLSSIGPKPTDIIISMASEPTDFGQPSPEVTQFFEAFSLKDGLCIWEYF